MEQSLSGNYMIFSTFPGYIGNENTQFHPLAFGSYNFGFLRVAYFP